MKILHFADAHIDMANYGRHDPDSGLPLRVLDFLKSLDVIIDTAISERVDLVLFAGDAYKDRSPSPTYQREWGRRIIRLSQARIPTLLLIGNHDLSPAIGRANAVQEFDTLQIPFVKVISRIQRLTPSELWDLPFQVVALPWITRSALLAEPDFENLPKESLIDVMEKYTVDQVRTLLDQTDPSLLSILLAHASVEGAQYGNERTIMLGSDMTLPSSLVKDSRWDYVALGHIHKAQNLNERSHPPVIYPGSIERVDFGEAGDRKCFVIAEIERGASQVTWRYLDDVRPFLDCGVTLNDSDLVTEMIRSSLPGQAEMEGAILRLTVTYPREMESLIDEPSISKLAERAFEFHLVRKPQTSLRSRLSPDQMASSLSPLDLLDQYWQVNQIQVDEELRNLARQIIEDEPGGDTPT